MHVYKGSYLDAFHAGLHIGVKPKTLNSNLSLVGKYAAPHITKAAPCDRCGRTLRQVQLGSAVRASVIKQVAKNFTDGLE